MNILLSILGIICGLIGGLRMPLPKWRLLGGLVALWMVLTGFNLLSASPHSMTSSSIFWMKLGGGALIGFGVGYFARPIWLNIWGRKKHKPMTEAEQDAALKNPE